MLIMADFSFAQTWTQTGAPVTNWQAVACSANGTTLVGVAIAYGTNMFSNLVREPGPVYISTNSGATWTQSSGMSDVWNSVACSADGTKMAAIAGFDGIYISTNSGSTWFLAGLSTHQFFWDSLAISADGTKWLAGGDDNGVYFSTNSGVSWTMVIAPIGYSTYWTSVAASADGNKWIVAGNEFTNENFAEGFVYTSVDSGATWTLQTNAPNVQWSSVTSSVGGNKLVATTQVTTVFSKGALDSEVIYGSTDAGSNWTQINMPYSGGWGKFFLSADGNKMAVASDFPVLGPPPQIQRYGQIYRSSDSGAIWLPIGAPAGDTNYCYVMASSADGNELVATANGAIYTWQTTSSPQLNLAASSSNLALSWTIPSTNFVLQQSADLVSWSNVTDPPVLNFATLQNQVAVTPTNAAAFYRLSTP